jgi:hypothetical protein
MSIFTEAQAKAILDKVIALSKADECTAVLAGSIDAATAPLDHFSETAPVGRAVRTRLHYEDRS